ncbi:maleylacetate reductase [Xanthobacteraceae bacterium Astr-EGSB]|uniref:maleylacetate reductase n=1 Tax=Astrobacterium formosum TaxID=3069710 RepID=UPI0027B5B5C9|nr:maleylacetate reductase [Xanthobacteraceae bacterium Astr-EGSB]
MFADTTEFKTHPAGMGFALPAGVYNATPPRIVFGPGRLGDIAAEVDRLGAKRALVLSTPGRHGLAERVVAMLGPRAVGLYPKAISQVPIELARAGREDALRLGADCLVSVGGGAAVGLGKGIALGTALPIINVPTTYSGSEMTGFCGITIDGIKRMHTSLDMLARTVIYDPELTLSLPADVSAASAMNALAHCVEALYVATASPIIRLAALDGIRAIAISLPRVVDAPDDIDARTQALYGAFMSGAALTGGFALHHGVAHVLGGSYGVPHAISHAVALPYVTAYNQDASPEVMAMVAAAFGANSAARGIYDFGAALGLPLRLPDCGVSVGDLDRCAEIVVETDNGLNPKPVTFAAVRGILAAAFAGGPPD